MYYTVCFFLGTWLSFNVIFAVDCLISRKKWNKTQKRSLSRNILWKTYFAHVFWQYMHTLLRILNTILWYVYHLINRMKIFPEEASFELANIPHSLSTCTIHRKYFKIEDILVDQIYGDCWVLWQWKGINITWTECNK